MINKEDLIKRIQINPKIMNGKPVTRIPVALILGLLADGWTHAEIFAEYDKIDEQEIAACLFFAQETNGPSTTANTYYLR